MVNIRKFEVAYIFHFPQKTQIITQFFDKCLGCIKQPGIEKVENL